MCKGECDGMERRSVGLLPAGEASACPEEGFVHAGNMPTPAEMAQLDPPHTRLVTGLL